MLIAYNVCNGDGLRHQEYADSDHASEHQRASSVTTD